MSTNAMLRYGVIGLLSLGAGCVDSGAPPPSSDAGNAALGIAEFRVEDSATNTSVIGLDANGKAIARMDLTHGRFELSGNNREGYDQFDVDGRRLHVEVGAQKLHWETEGYEPTLQMPAHPAGNARLAAFLDDPHVKPVLERWQIGFEKTATSDELAYWSENNVYSGVNRRNLYNLAGSTTWASPTKSYNTCGGGGVKPTSAWAVGDSGSGQTVVAQCCPPTYNVLGGATSWFGIKSCPHSGTSSLCGTSTATCKACPEYPTFAVGCAVSATGSNPYYLNYVFSGGTYDVPGFSYGNTLGSYNQIPETATEVDGSMEDYGWTFSDPYYQCYTQFTQDGQNFTCVGSGGMNPYLGNAIIHAVHSDGRTTDIEFNTQPY